MGFFYVIYLEELFMKFMVHYNLTCVYVYFTLFIMIFKKRVNSSFIHQILFAANDNSDGSARTLCFKFIY